MKKITALFFAIFTLFALAFPAFATSGQVTYRGRAGEFVFAPGSDYSLTDLFPNFKGVMPGDTLTQKITVKNEADNKVKVKIYLRSQGAHEDSVEFLSKLGLVVEKSAENEMSHMFDAAASEPAQLSDWVCLGTLYSGGSVDLDVTLQVPVDLDNSFQEKIGYLDWEFMVEEYPVEETDPKPPQTGDESHLSLWVTLLVLSLSIIIFLLVFKKKEKKENFAKH